VSRGVSAAAAAGTAAARLLPHTRTHNTHQKTKPKKRRQSRNFCAGPLGQGGKPSGSTLSSRGGAACRELGYTTYRGGTFTAAIYRAAQPSTSCYDAAAGVIASGGASFVRMSCCKAAVVPSITMYGSGTGPRANSRGGD
jgi:hypothetical protein